MYNNFLNKNKIKNNSKEAFFIIYCFLINFILMYMCETFLGGKSILYQKMTPWHPVLIRS